MSFDKQRYKYIVLPNKVIAISTYAGKTVKGIAKCDPRDKFDVNKGKELAAARCNLKVAEKRELRADRKREEAIALYHQAITHLAKMDDYYQDAFNASNLAHDEVKEVLHQIEVGD